MNYNISVIIPTFKRKDSLIQTILLLKKQKEVNLEIIVVDQNLDDFFEQEIIDILKTVVHIKLPSPNASKARNIGFLRSTAQNILFIDDDLVPNENFCNNLLTIFNKYKDINCLVPIVYNSDGIEFERCVIEKKKIRYHPQNRNLIQIKDTRSACIFFRRETYNSSGGFDEYLFDFAKTGEDQEFFYRFYRKKNLLWSFKEITIFHDEGFDGGCELRTKDYWITRQKCVKSWIFRTLISSSIIGKLSIKDFIVLSRSSFLNKQVLNSGFKNIIKQIKIFSHAIRETKIFLKDITDFYQNSNYTFLK